MYQTEISRQSTGYYKLAFFNDGIDWVESQSTKTGAKCSCKFTGPNIKIFGSKGPSYGKLRLRIISTTYAQNEEEKIALDWTEVDCYSNAESNSVIFEKTDLDYLEYILEIETLEDKNILSTGKSIKINKVSFLRNFYLSLDKQEINPDLSFKSIGGVR